MKRIIFVIAMCFYLTACTNESAAYKALDNLGFTDIKLNGYAFFSCPGKEYWASTAFTAKNPNGKVVTGAVCSGPLTASSVKFD